MNGQSHFEGAADDSVILTLWKQGKDTFEIGQILWMKEATIANRLPKILERDRQDQEWNFESLAAERNSAHA